MQTRYLKWKLLVLRHSLCRPCMQVPQVLRGTMTALLQERLLVRYPFVRSFPLPIEQNGLSCSQTVTADGRGLVAVGCAEGVWIGLRHDPKCKIEGSLIL